MKPNSIRVAVADTDRTVLELLQIRLELAGYQTFLSRSSSDLLELVRNIRPSVMLLDFNFNETGAKGVLEQLRRKNQLTFPFMVMGRKMTKDTLQEAMEMGAKACIIKPFSGADVVERVSWAMRPAPNPQRPVHYLNA
jgi:DNA-binding response OmpR family regulator